MKLRLIVSALVLLILALGFNVLLNFTSLHKLYVESSVSQYRVIAKDLQQKLERSLRFGKEIKKFVGIKQILEETQRNIKKRVSLKDSTAGAKRNPATASYLSVSVALPDGSILYCTNEEHANAKLPAQARVNFEYSGDEEKPSLDTYYVRLNDIYILTQPVRDRQNKWVATVVIEFGAKQIKTHLKALLNNNLKTIIIILVCSIMLLITSLNLVTPNRSGGQGYPKTKIVLIMLLVISSAQIVFSGINTRTFRDHYLQISKEKSQIITRLLKEDVEYILSKGIRIDRLSKLDVLMGETIAAYPELNDVTVFDKSGHPLYMVTKSGVMDSQTATDHRLLLLQNSVIPSDPGYNVRFNLTQNGQTEGYISTNITKDLLFKKVFEIAMDSITVIVISILFLVEMLILIFKFVDRPTTAANPAKMHYGMMRPAAFLFLFGIDLSISFLPLHMEQLYVPLFGLSRDVIMGLPISVEFLFVGISILISGIWLDRRGWHEPFLSGLILAAAGVFYSWLAPDALHFIISRGMVGLGYGLTLMASQGFVIAASGERRKTQGLANLFAGIYAGSICGGATGALLAERIGYTPVFFIGAVILLSVIAYTGFFMGHATQKQQRFVVEKHLAPVRIGKIFRFLSNWNVLCLIFFCNLPAAIAVVGFLNYFSPIYLHRMGASQSTIGRVFMIYGIFLIYFAPFISKHVDTALNKKTYVVFGCILGSMAFLTFSFLEGLAAAATAVLLLGLSGSLIFAPQSAYILKLKVSEELGAGKAIGILSSTERAGQVLGPIVFSGIIVATNIHQGVIYFGLAYLVTAFLFLILTQADGKMAVMEHKIA